ncbi:glycosyltransferase [Microbacterium sp. JZ37]|uniref:glycosyltransferase n=1 Tax=Microbacterium sp. JZ37 TaxID=2654193 RepID=UPI002B47CE3B|nr:glycosyltransferase [Microbacterium sp. JZ37]WRH16556.1 glycosyltransferase [Microbacterium sp. JZ37]
MLHLRPMLPRGRQYALTWSVDDTWGGMTSAMLHRSRAFVRLADRPVTVLTFDPDPDYPAREERLRREGMIIDRMALLNLWDWLRENPLPGGSLRPDRHPFTPLATLSPRDGERLSERRRGDTVLSRVRASEGGEILQTDHFRADGSLLLSERRDVAERGTPGGKSVVLCDGDGRPVRSWGRIAHLYRAWLDALTEDEPSYLVVDSKTVARWAMDYRRPHAVTMHVVHASHLVGRRRPMGRLRESRRPVFENLDAFDAVVLLTRRQRDDVVALLGEHACLDVVPNGRDLPEAPPLEGRPPGAGIMLASLTRRKRVAHAMAAVRAARSVGLDVELDVWGEGEDRASLAPLADDSIRLRGYAPDAAAHLERSSFLLSTSTSEGFPLVLIEALAAGCVPIAYDVPYRAADIIRDGENGFLVPAGDEEALAAAVARFVGASEAERMRMRRAAVESAQRFSDEDVTRAWGQAMRRAHRRKHRLLRR